MPYRQSEKSELRKETRKKHILRTAADAFSSKGYHQTSVKDIADASGISVGTFYLYFKNKEEIFEKLYDEMWAYILSLIAYAEKDISYSPSQVLARTITANLWGYKRFNKLSKIMLIEAIGINPRFQAKYTELMLESVSRMKSGFSQLMRSGSIQIADLDVAATAYIGAVNNVITCLLLSEREYNLNSCAYSLIIFLMQALNMDFDRTNIKHMIDDMINELESNHFKSPTQLF